MTIQSLFLELLVYKLPIVIVIAILPWATYGICFLIPGRKEEPYVLSVNIAVSLLLLIIWIGYLVYAFSGGGFRQIMQEADFILLLLPIYHLVVSLWLSKMRIPLEDIPAYRFMKGLGMMSLAFCALVWIASKIRIVFFSFLPFSTFLYIVGAIIAFGFVGLRMVKGKKR